ncbi:MAG: S9 family peptidase [Bacteroidales bacterium]|nr:S9 family peptidase [Bacteroidales bacterium]
MKRIFLFQIILLTMASSCSLFQRNTPEAAKNPKQFEEFGNTRTDNYYWMNNRKDPEVMAYIKAENDYLDKNFKKPYQKLIDKVYKELQSRIVEDDNTVPYFDNGYYYNIRYEKDQEYEIYCRRKHLDSAEEILLNVNDIAKKYSYVDVDNVVVSPDNDVLAYALDTISRRKYEINFKQISGKRNLIERIPDTDGQMEFSANSEKLFYIAIDPVTLRSFKLFKHTVNQHNKSDEELFYEDDDTYDLLLDKSKSGKYIFLTHYSTNTTEVRYLDSSTPDAEFKIFRKRNPGTEYYLEHGAGRFWMRTNEYGKNFCIMSSESANPESFTIFKQHDNNVYITDFEVFDNFIVIEERKNGLTVYEIIDLKTKESHFVNFGEDSYDVTLDENPESSTDNLRYIYSSFTTPSSVIDYNMKTKEKTVLKEAQVPGYDKSKYELKRLYAKSRDGVDIPLTILYKKDIDLKNENNLLLYAYGSYGVCEEDSYYRSIFSLIDRGFIYAVAHVRGGSELGYEWYDNGRLLKKKNTFNDFVDVSQFLINEHYTSPEHLFAEGGSAGGLLMGVIANTNPELYKAIIAEVPFVDVINTMLDPSIPLTTGEYDEWGNPNEKEYYDYMLSYSPYDNVTEQDYPAMLVTTGLHDSQVQFWEPVKWTAKLRELKTDNNPLYLSTNMKAGHSGASGRYSRYKETAMIYAFILSQAGFKE